MLRVPFVKIALFFLSCNYRAQSVRIAFFFLLKNNI
nr:MAG TPA: hypothetical protein [Caudoviricetes sp.]